MEQRNVKLTVAYDGSGYHGWQRQTDNIITVQQVLESAIVKTVHHPINLRGSGRTDTAVHALGQVANFFTNTQIPTEKLYHAINSRLPDKSIRVRKSEDVSEKFDAITSAKSKLYRYAMFNHEEIDPRDMRYCYHYSFPCDANRMSEAAKLLLGEHDFTSFASAGNDRECNIRHLMRCDVSREGHWIYFELEANGFLYNMVRNIVGTLVEIGRSHWAVEKIPEILAALDRKEAGFKAPAEGLTLMWVKY